ncbi:MAG: hypothetical protein DMG11_01645 [Acidobacteria bacterium]|nr:MAG: hypothetical protein DMG11_01645 [Acidobacteriota bacterium]
MVVTRRDFLKSSGLALAAFVAAPNVWAGKEHPIIIAIFQRGAADGLSMVVPFADKHYYSVRQQIAIPEPLSSGAERAIDLDGFFGLHPALDSLKPIYDQGHLAIVHAAGSPDNTRSQFDAQDYMESGTPGNKGVADGWLNRYIQADLESDSTPFRAIAIGANTPRSLMGTAPAVAMNRIADFGVHGGGATPEMENAFAEMYRDTFEAVKLLRRANPQQYEPARGANYPNSPYGQALLQIAQLVKADIGLEVAFVDVGGWDTHANQGSSRGQLANHLKEFGDGLAAMYRDLDDCMRNIVIVTMTEFGRAVRQNGSSMTEFGRAVRQNGSGGTDHGHASCMFVCGGPVKGGKVYGRWPGLAPEQLFEGRDLALTTDFRDVLAELLVKHMDAKDVSKVFPQFRPGGALKLL